jgi:predicted nuclease of predicted toxin-antitoxin system
MARTQHRVLVSFDAAFGEPMFEHGEPPPPAIVSVRLHPFEGAAAAVMAAAALRDAVEGCFVVSNPRCGR